MDRDRAVDESGNQIGVFGRRGARPLNGEEQRRMYLRDGKLFTVTGRASGAAGGRGGDGQSQTSDWSPRAELAGAARSARTY